MVWRRWQSQQARRVFRYTFLLLLPFLGPLLALAGCGAPPLPVTHRPAADIRLEIRINGQYRGRYSDGIGANVLVEVRVFDGTDKRGVAVADKAHLTCNGTDITRQSPADSAAGLGICPRQAPGGSYQITYTDEHGASTSVIVPVPTGSFSMLSPLDGLSVPIPVSGMLTVRVSLPTPPPNGAVVVDSVYAHCGINCSGMTAILQNDATPTANPSADAVSTVRNGGDRGLAPRSNNLFSATPTPPNTATPGPTAPPVATPTPEATQTQRPIPPPATATITQDGGAATITLQGDFSAFRPISGEVGVHVEARIAPDAGGFAAVTAVFGSEDIYSAITWTR